MRIYPENEIGIKEALEKLGAEKWQLECLKKNPEYVNWGNTEDYMSNKNTQWGSPIELESVDELWGLDELNELVNFYFEITRDSESCVHCGGSGLNPETNKLYESWYSFDDLDWVYLKNLRYNNKAWQYHLEEPEIKALVKGGRLRDLMKISCYFDEETQKWYGWKGKEKVEIEEPEYPTPEEVNNWAINSCMGHDSINRWIAVKARAEHLGVFGYCEHCKGNGCIYIEEEAHLGLQMWFLHPRKGASRGVYLKDIRQEELPKVIEYLKQARDRNADRFSKL